MGSFNKAQYDMEYAKQNVVRKYLAFNKNFVNDIAILEWLDRIGKGNVNEYIKGLILADMKKSTVGS